MKKKLFTAVILTVAALTLVVASVLGTVAYLTANSAVSNVFTVGDVKIEMFEHKVDSEGQVALPLVETDTNSYHLVPGKTYAKNPTIRITSRLDQDKMYLFVKSSNQIRTIEAGNSKVPGDIDEDTMREQMENNGWVEFVRSGNGIEIVWVYGVRDAGTGVITPTAVGPDDVQSQVENGEKGLFRLFDTFTISKHADVSLYGAAKVSFTAFAIQTSGFSGDTLTKDAWEALKSAYPYEGGIINPVNPYNNSTTDPYAPVPGVNGPIDIDAAPPVSENP